MKWTSACPQCQGRNQHADATASYTVGNIVQETSSSALVILSSVTTCLRSDLPAAEQVSCLTEASACELCVSRPFSMVRSRKV